jgi:hypothetical protein
MASGTQPGLVSTDTQTYTGVKTFTSGISSGSDVNITGNMAATGSISSASDTSGFYSFAWMSSGGSEYRNFFDVSGSAATGDDAAVYGDCVFSNVANGENACFFRVEGRYKWVTNCATTTYITSALTEYSDISVCNVTKPTLLWFKITESPCRYVLRFISTEVSAGAIACQFTYVSRTGIASWLN